MTSTNAAALKPTLEVVNISKSFGGAHVLSGVTMAIASGTVLGLIGPNGAGKTTLLNIVSGFLKANEGEVRYHGARIDRLPAHRIAARGLGRVFQDTKVFDLLSVMENVLMAIHGQQGEDAVSALCGRGYPTAPHAAQIARNSLELVGLDHKSAELAAALSSGEQKLLALARLFAMRATGWLLDEPTAGVTAPMVERIVGIVRRSADEGALVVLVSHEMKVVSECCDLVCLMNEGRIAAVGTPSDVMSSVEMRRAYLGEI